MSADNRFDPIKLIMYGQHFFLIIGEFLCKIELMLVLFVQVVDESVTRMFLLILFDLFANLAPLFSLDVVELCVESLAEGLLVFECAYLEDLRGEGL